MTISIEKYIADFIQSMTEWQLVLFYILAVSLLFQLFYYLFFYARVAFYNKYKIEIEKQPVSIVICARNENENLTKFLPTILEQKYPKFEVIVVNDCSTDDSAITLYSLKEKYPHLYYTNIPYDPKFEHSKKLALTVGIKAAKYEWVLLTDADCQPNSLWWLDKMQRNFTAKIDFVFGYGGYFKEKKIVNFFIRFDTVSIALQYLSFALAGIPYMGVGRNMAYRRAFFFDKKGFAKHNHIVSGDDDLFVNQNAEPKRTTIEVNWESLTHSVPENNFKNWFKQKRRHMSTSKYYKLKHKILLTLEPFSRILFYFSFVFLIISSKFSEVFVSIFALRFLIQHLIYYKTYAKFNERDLIFTTFIFDIIMPFVYLIISFNRAFLKNKNTWR